MKTTEIIIVMWVLLVLVKCIFNIYSLVKSDMTLAKLFVFNVHFKSITILLTLWIYGAPFLVAYLY